MKLVSVLMPTYNVDKFVKEAVESILYQTWENFELIIVDDCSTDNTFTILKTLANKDRRIKLYRNSKNSKICKTLNKALTHAKGEYIARMDGDDISMPNRLEIMVKYLENNKDIALTGSFAITIDENNKELSKKQYPITDDAIKRGNKYMPCIAHIWMARSDIYTKLNGYRNIPLAEDYDFLLRGELMDYQFHNINRFLYKIRIRNGNSASTNGLMQRKTAAYVKKIHKIELASHKEEYDLDKYNKAIVFKNDEQEKYLKGVKYLSKAIHNKQNKKIMLLYAFRAACSSKYIFKYLVDSIMVRIIIKYE